MKTGFTSLTEARLADLDLHRRPKLITRDSGSNYKNPVRLPKYRCATDIDTGSDGFESVVQEAPVEYQLRLSVFNKRPLAIAFPPTEVQYLRDPFVEKFLRRGRWNPTDALGSEFQNGDRVSAVCRNKVLDSKELPNPTILEAGFEWRDTTYIVTKGWKRVALHIRPRDYGLTVEEQVNEGWIMTLATAYLSFSDESALELAFAMLR